MIIERTIQGFRISAMIDGTRISRHYIGYNRRESLAEFRRLLEVQ